jgi:hypothetical protein
MIKREMLHVERSQIKPPAGLTTGALTDKTSFNLSELNLCRKRARGTKYLNLKEIYIFP